MKHTWRRPEARALSSIFTQTIIHVPHIIIIKGTNVVTPIPQCCPIQCKAFPKQKNWLWLVWQFKISSSAKQINWKNKKWFQIQHNTTAANPHPRAMPWGVCMSMFIKSHILIERDFFCWPVRKFPSTLGIRWVLPVFKGIQKNTACKLGGLWQGDWHRLHWVYLQWTGCKATGCCDGACQVWTKEHQEIVALIAIQVQGTSNNFKIKKNNTKIEFIIIFLLLHNYY